MHEGRLAAVHGFHGLPEPIVGHCLLNHLIGAGEKDFIDIIGHSAEPDTPPPRMAITSIWWHGVEHRERLAYRRRRLTSRSTSAGRKLVEVKERRRPTGGSSSGSTVEVPLTLPTPLTGQSIRITVEGVRRRTTVDYYSQVPTALPIGIAEVGIPGLAAA